VSLGAWQVSKSKNVSSKLPPLSIRLRPKCGLVWLFIQQPFHMPAYRASSSISNKPATRKAIASRSFISGALLRSYVLQCASQVNLSLQIWPHSFGLDEILKAKTSRCFFKNI